VNQLKEAATETKGKQKKALKLAVVKQKVDERIEKLQ